MTLVTVTPSLAAFFWTASQISSETRMVRVGVLGAFGDLTTSFNVMLKLVGTSIIQ